ncbi:MAG: tetratricopeptide repeat protein [Acidobacteria bacterium]|nr:MAG: tetratricopeptide repeat protein [Acidobacteriota bacterium]
MAIVLCLTSMGGLANPIPVGLASARRGALIPGQQETSTSQRERRSRAQAIEEAREQAIAAFEAGQRAHQRGALTEAIEHYDAALKIIPDFPEALYQRGMARLALKQWDAARDDLLRLVQLESEAFASEETAQDPQVRSFFARVHSALGDIFSQQGDRIKAEHHYRQAIKLDPRLLRATTGLATLLIERRAFSEAAEHLRAAIDAGATAADLYALLGYVYEQLHRSDEAEKSYSRAIELEPHHRLARERRSRLRAAEQNIRGAIDDLLVLYQQEPSAARAQELAALYERARQWDEAIDFYRKAAEASSDAEQIKRLRLKLIDLLVSADRSDEALAEARQLAQAHPDDAHVLAYLGHLLLDRDPAQAARAYARALTLDRDNVDYQIGLSAALIKLKRFKEAVAVSLDALNRAPDNYYVHSNLATAYFELQDFAHAAEHFQWITAHRPTAVVAYYFLGICYDKLMEYESALEAYQRFLERADARQYRMEMDNVRFRLPGLRRAIEKGRGRRRK